MTMKTKVEWYWCTYHNRTSQDASCCPLGDTSYANHCTCVGPWGTSEEAENAGLCLPSRSKESVEDNQQASETLPPAVYCVFARQYDKTPAWWFYAGHKMWVRPDRIRGTKFFADHSGLEIVPNIHQDEGDLAFFNAVIDEQS